MWRHESGGGMISSNVLPTSDVINKRLLTLAIDKEELYSSFINCHPFHHRLSAQVSHLKHQKTGFYDWSKWEKIIFYPIKTDFCTQFITFSTNR